MSFDGKVRGTHFSLGSLEGLVDADNSKLSKAEFEKSQELINPVKGAREKDFFQNHLLNENPKNDSAAKNNIFKNAGNDQSQGMVVPKKNDRLLKNSQKESKNAPIESQVQKQKKIEKGVPNNDQKLVKNIDNRQTLVENSARKKDKVEPSETSHLPDHAPKEKKENSSSLKSVVENKKTSPQGAEIEGGEKNSELRSKPRKNEAQNQVTDSSVDSHDGLMGMKAGLSAIKAEFGKIPVLSLLTGRLEELEPQSIVNMVAFNSFIQKALNEADLEGYFQKNVDLESFLGDLEVPEDLINDIKSIGIDLSIVGTPYLLLKAMGVDAQQVKAEIQVLKDNLSLGSIDGYLMRAKALATKRSSSRELSNSNSTFNSLEIGQDNIMMNKAQPKFSQGEIIEVDSFVGSRPIKKATEFDGVSLKNSGSVEGGTIQDQGFKSTNIKNSLGQVDLGAKGSHEFSQMYLSPNQISNPTNQIFEGQSVRENGLMHSVSNSTPQNFQKSSLLDSSFNNGNVPLGVVSDSVLSESLAGQKASYDHWFYQGKLTDFEQISRLDLESNKSTIDITQILEGNIKSDPSSAARISELNDQKIEELRISAMENNLAASMDQIPSKLEENHWALDYLDSPENMNHNLAFSDANKLADLAKVNPANKQFEKSIEAQAAALISEISQGNEMSIEGKHSIFEGESYLGMDPVSYREDINGLNVASSSPFEGAFRGDSAPNNFGGSQHEGLLAKESGASLDPSGTSVERARMVQKIFDSAQSLAINGGGQIQLNFPDSPWGRLDISIQMIESQLNIRISGVEDALRDSLKADLNTLSTMLESRKIEIGKIEFMKSNPASSSFSSMEQFRQGARQNLDDHRAHREWIDDLRTQVRLSNKSLGRMYKA
jgi:hypothetical protein